MSAKSLLRAGIASPRALRSPSTPRSILKRPPPLPLSQNPAPFTGRVTVVVSPSLDSPHVHFPPSPGLTATFTTHSPNSYDRGAINVSPNPLEIPAWGSRVYSPGSDSFEKLSEANESSSEEELTPKFKTFTPPLLSLNSPTNVEIFPKSPGADTKPTTRAGARFQAIASQSLIRPVSGLGEALKAYPRSPYPSAPASPAPAVLADKENTGVDNENQLAGRVWSRTKTVSGYGSNPSRISRAKKVPPAITIIGRTTEMVSSPLRQEFLTPVQESPQHTATVANANGNTNADASLTQAFWQSMSLDETVDMSSPCITTEDPVASGLFSPGGMISPMIFATKDGVVWSQPRQDALKKDLMMDVHKSDSPQGMVMSPSPEDPFAAFPSFAAVLSLDHGTEASIIAYPPPAVTVESSVERR